jgi:hypothetical protein
MKTRTLLNLGEAVKLLGKQPIKHYWHDRLPSDFIRKAERTYDRLKGIDSFVDNTPKAEWIDLFRMERSPESGLADYAQRLAAVSKAERKWGKQSQPFLKAFYLLTIVRGFCQTGEEAFRLAETYYGIRFAESEKKRIMKVIESCVSYRPIVYGHDVVPERTG